VLPTTRPASAKREEVKEVESSGSGEVAPAADSDSDAFSSAGWAEFRAGKVVAHLGRKVKTVKPHLSLAGERDLMSLPSPITVVLEISVDETGKVRNVEVARSSGSSEVDQPCQLAVYDWWFEPPHDKSGRPLPTAFLFSFRWYVN
jgi:TonB family protein